jgi:hypothetical protein
MFATHLLQASSIPGATCAQHCAQVIPNAIVRRARFKGFANLACQTELSLTGEMPILALRNLPCQSSGLGLALRSPRPQD